MCICVGGAVVEVQHHSHDPSSPRRCPDTCPYTHALSLTRMPSPLIAHIVPTFVLTRMSSPSHTCPRPQTHALDLALTHMSSPSHACPMPSPSHACPHPHTHALTPDHPHTFDLALDLALTRMPSPSLSHAYPNPRSPTYLRPYTHALDLVLTHMPSTSHACPYSNTHALTPNHLSPRTGPDPLMGPGPLSVPTRKPIP